MHPPCREPAMNEIGKSRFLKPSAERPSTAAPQAAERPRADTPSEDSFTHTFPASWYPTPVARSVSTGAAEWTAPTPSSPVAAPAPAPARSSRSRKLERNREAQRRFRERAKEKKTDLELGHAALKTELAAAHNEIAGLKQTNALLEGLVRALQSDNQALRDGVSR